MMTHAPELHSLTINGRIPRQPEAPATSNGVVLVEAVSHRYTRRGPTIVDGVSLELHAGRVHCLLGDSGSGKTTLLRLVAGLERPVGGRILINGTLLSGKGRFVPPEKRPVGFVFQDYALFPHLCVRKNVMFGMSHRRRSERGAVADELLTRVGMTGYERAMPHTLSGGQQQRVALARALARDPAVMLLDEPFSGLDAALRDRVRDETLRILRQANVATLMVTHDPREALIASDAVSVMRQGRIVATGDPQNVCVCQQDSYGTWTVRLCTEAGKNDSCSPLDQVRGFGNGRAK